VKLNLDSTEPDVRIEIVPLIDVIFCILTFFILAAVTLTRQAAINVDLPRASTGTTQMRQNLLVSVDQIGQIYIEKLPVSREQLLQGITNFRQQNPQGLVVLSASRSASYNDVVQVLDLLRSAGGDRVALATLPGEDGATALPELPTGTSNPVLPPTGLPNGTTLPNRSPGPVDPFKFDPAPTSPQSGGINQPGSSGLEFPTTPSRSPLPGSSENQ
jgi:biopolymer transport protein ExbD